MKNNQKAIQRDTTRVLLINQNGPPKKKKKSQVTHRKSRNNLKIKNRVETKNLKNEISDLTLIVPIIRLNINVYI